MGYGSYRASDWTKLKTSRGLNSSVNANQTFVRQQIKESLDSKYITIRESLDSEDSPNSTPVILGFDVTGSMGYLANEIATNTLNETITKILSQKSITNPHMMCAAFTNSGNSLQATQFEADIRVVEQLLDFKLGGGNPYAADNLLWYFAAKHTRIDSFEKRGKKGILIGIGDEKCGGESNILGFECLPNVFGDKFAGNIGFLDAYKMASEKYEVIHIEIGPDYRFIGYNGGKSVFREWCEWLPGRVARLHAANVTYMSDLIVTIIHMLQGTKREDALDLIEDKKAREIVRSAIAYMYFEAAGESQPPVGKVSRIAILDANSIEEKDLNKEELFVEIEPVTPCNSVTKAMATVSATKSTNQVEQVKDRKTLGERLHDIFGNRK